jgi:hypothetical protein
MQCHGNLHARKMGPLSRQTLWLEDIAVDTWVPSSFGTVVMPLFQGLCTPPAWHTFTSLACGWAPGHGPSHHHDLCVADGGNHRQALFTLLSHVRCSPVSI